MKSPMRIRPLSGVRRTAVARPLVAGFAAAAATHVLVAAAAAAEATANDALPFPGEVGVVMERGEIEGHPVRILRFRSPSPVARVLADTRRAWAMDVGPETVDAASGPWRILSRQEEGGYRTLQVRPLPDGGAEGLVTVWGRHPALPAPRIDPAGLLPPQAQIRRRLAAVDAGRRSETVVAFDEAAPALVSERLRARIEAAGLRASTRERGDRGAGDEPLVRLYHGTGVELALTVHPQDGGSVVVVHLIEVQR